MRKFSFSIDQAFPEVVAACGDPTRPDGWITPEFRDAYTELHRLGWAHSAEVWLDDDLVGGVYGVSIGSLFAGESMFHRVTDASKAALVALVTRLRELPNPLFEVQWLTPHLESLGAVEIGRSDYIRRLSVAISETSAINWGQATTWGQEITDRENS
jgi:leucyl/phenylalanyl-tRNA--protein transferase